MRNLVFILGSLLLASCATPPKTVGEFRVAMVKRPAFTKQETHDINRDFSVVVKDLDRKSRECLQFGYTTSTRAGSSMRKTSTVYHPQVRVTGTGKAELVLQMEMIPKAAGSPEGGAYIFLADLDRQASTRTRMTMYGPSFPTWQPIFDAVKGWAQGKNVKCPDSP